MGRKDKKKRQQQEQIEEESSKKVEEKQEEPEEKEIKQIAVLEPKKVQYCPVCTYPFQLCKYGKKAKNCKKFLQEVAPTKVAKYHPEGEGQVAQESETKTEQKVEQKKEKGKKDKSIKDKYIVIIVKERTKKKFVTNVTGLQNFKIQAKQMSKKLSKKFACSVSASNSNEIQVQGDFEQDIREMLKADYGVKKKYILDKQQFKQKEAQEKQKRKAAKNADKMVIPEEPEEEEKKQQVEPEQQKKPKFKTQFQQALANVSDSDEEGA